MPLLIVSQLEKKKDKEFLKQKKEKKIWEKRKEKREKGKEREHRTTPCALTVMGTSGKTPSPAFLCSQVLLHAALTSSSCLYCRGVITVPFSARSVVGQFRAQAGNSARCTLCWMDETWHFQLGHSHKAWLAVALPCSPAPRAASSDSAVCLGWQLQGKDFAPCPVLQWNYHRKI